MMTLPTLTQMLSPLNLAAYWPYDYYWEDMYPAYLSAFTGIVIFWLFLFIALYVVNAIFLMKLFAKANVPAWKAWVPVVNTWKFLELGGYHGAFSLLVLAVIIPCIGWLAAIGGIVVCALAAYQIGLKNRKDGVWVVLYLFLGVVWTGILGLGASTWDERLGKPALGHERPPHWHAPYGGGAPGSGF